MADVIVVATPGDAGRLVADHIAERVLRQPTMVLGVATGSTPLPVYGALSEHAAAGVNFGRIRAFALDDYVGLPDGHREGYRSVLEREVGKPLELTSSQIHVPDGSLEGLPTAGERFEQELIASGGVDIQLLGIGTHGHLGFNEPGSSLGSLTRVKTLAAQTRHDNARFFGSIDDVPLQSVTQGLGTIARARHLILLAFGSTKAQAITAALEGPITASVPASMIQMHPHVTVVLDHEAATDLANRDYYRLAQQHKPTWQGL